jgi:hypothetical protein
MAEVQKTLTGKRKARRQSSPPPSPRTPARRPRPARRLTLRRSPPRPPRTVAKDTWHQVRRCSSQGSTVEATAKTVTREQGEPSARLQQRLQSRFMTFRRRRPGRRPSPAWRRGQGSSGTGPQGAEASAAGQASPLTTPQARPYQSTASKWLIDGVPRPSAQAVGIQKFRLMKDVGKYEDEATNAEQKKKATFPKVHPTSVEIGRSLCLSL